MTTPSILYGTAWKEERTRTLTREALHAGFRGIDTANQRKHYFEEAVGLGFLDFLKESGKKRAEFFLQSKYTFRRGQDHRLPYDETASLSTQVEQSFQNSLEHFQTDYLDSYVLHGPASSLGLDKSDHEVWGAMELRAKTGQAKKLGISNCDTRQLLELLQVAKIKPSFVQNRCYAITGWDFEMRELCRENQIVYQGFSLLTANLDYITREPIKLLARKYGRTIPQIIFQFAMARGMLPLTGTSNPQHMTEDLASDQFQMTADELQLIEEIAA